MLSLKYLESKIESTRQRRPLLAIYSNRLPITLIKEADGSQTVVEAIGGLTEVAKPTTHF